MLWELIYKIDNSKSNWNWFKNLCIRSKFHNQFYIFLRIVHIHLKPIYFESQNIAWIGHKLAKSYTHIDIWKDQGSIIRTLLSWIHFNVIYKIFHFLYRNFRRKIYVENKSKWIKCKNLSPVSWFSINIVCFIDIYVPLYDDDTQTVWPNAVHKHTT